VISTPVRRLRLGTAWARVVGVGWIGITLGLASVGASSQVVGRPVWWADDVRWGTTGVIALVLLVFASSTAVTSIAFLRGPAIPQVSIVGGVLLAVSAVVDRHSSPGGAVVTGALAASAILIGVGALSGRCSDQDLDSRAANSPTTSS
jgi:hypothetical protein